MVAIGVDIGGSHILCAGIDLEQKSLIEGSENLQKIDPSWSKEKLLEAWATAINKSLNSCSTLEITGIGFAMPGPFDYKQGIAWFEGDNQKFENLYSVNVRQELTQYLAQPNLDLRFLNDATSFGVGVVWFGEAKGFHRSIVLTLGTGFGSTFIENGIPVTDRADVPKDGFFWNVHFQESIADDYFSTRWFKKAYQDKFDKEIAGVKEIAAHARKDHEAAEIFQTFGTNLGAFLTPWIKKFPADIIVLGGNIAKSFDLFGTHCMAFFQNQGLHIELKVATNADHAALLGSAMLFDRSFWNRMH